MTDAHNAQIDMKSLKDEIWLKDSEVALLLDFSVSKLRNDRYCKRGLPYHRFDRAIRYRKSDIDKIIKDGRVEPTNNSPSN